MARRTPVDSSPPRWPPRRLLKGAGLALIATVVFGVLVGVGFGSVIRIPDVDTIADEAAGLMTQVLDRRGQAFQTYERDRRSLIEDGEMPDLVRDVIVAAEDQNFYRHGGVDLWSILRSALINLRSGEIEQGASTITMQVARNYFDLTREKLWRRKITEAFIAVELEKSFSKEQILRLYANVVNMHYVYGFKEGSRYFFGEELEKLRVDQVATLAAVMRRPADTPYNRPELVKQRRDLILGRMRDGSLLTSEEHARAVNEPIEAIRQRRRFTTGRYFSEEVRRHLIDTYGADSLYDRGLIAETTLDLEMQKAAERSVRRGLSQLDEKRNGWRGAHEHLNDEDLESVRLPSWLKVPPQLGEWHQGVVLSVEPASAQIKISDFLYALDLEGAAWTKADALGDLLEPGDVAWFEMVADTSGETGEDGLTDRVLLRQEPEMEAALVLIESRTGAIRALVGGWNYGRSEFNRATQARRQVGSAFKPFIFGAALEMGYTPADTLFDAPVVFRGIDNLESYSPRNFKRKYNGILTLRRALELSINVTTAKLLDLVGVEGVIDFARRCGIKSHLPPYPSLALGTAELTPLELAAAYTTLANQGVRIDPFLIERVSTRDGHVLEEHVMRPAEVVAPQISFLLTRMLEGVIDRGTGISARYLDVELAGKTGTTDFFTDAWFAGYTPKFSLLVWVGYDQNRYLGRGMTGAVAALPIWRLMIEAGLEEGWIDPDTQFRPPPGLSMRWVEYRTGLLPGKSAKSVVRETFIAGTEPVQSFDDDWDRILTLPWYQQRPFYGLPKAGERMPEDVADWSLVQDAWETKDDPEGDEDDEESARPAG